MRQIWSGRAVQAVAKVGEHAPTATVCCNACRTCVQTNLIGLGLAAIGGASIAVARFAPRPTSDVCGDDAEVAQVDHGS
jgi:hypothetical protein